MFRKSFDVDDSSSNYSDENYGAENIYCGYCCKLIECQQQQQQQRDNNQHFIIFCISCRGSFHLNCTALSATPLELIKEQSLEWKCNNCVKNDATMPSDPLIAELKDDLTPVEYDDPELNTVLERKLKRLRFGFGKDLQHVYARITQTDVIEETLNEDDCVVINNVIRRENNKLLQLISTVSTALGIRLTPLRKVIQSEAYELSSFIIRFDSQATRQLLLNSYLNSIMRPIAMPSKTIFHQNQLQHNNDMSANSKDLEASSTTCLLPRNGQPPILGANNHLYMYEFLSPQNQTMLVKSITSNDLIHTGNQYDNDNDTVFHDETTHAIIPVIKISTVPRRVRLASKECFDEFEDNNNNNLPPIQSSSSIVSIVSTASAAGSEPSDGHSESQIIPSKHIHPSKARVIPEEKWWQTTLQISIPFFLAGVGTTGAGIILGIVQDWDVFKDISQLFILVPSLLGLKGNLDMCLASRLSTQANLGNMVSKKVILKMIVGNIALVQVQATVAAFIVSMFAIIVGSLMQNSWNFSHSCVMTASAMFTATSSCFVLDFFLIAMVLTSIRLKMNPDNLATPLAASIGDVVSLSVFSFIASQLFKIHDTHLWVTFIVVVIYIILLPIWILIVLNNEYTRPVLKSGWVPVLSALFISGVGGIVLDSTIDKFKGFAIFQPIINGIGGNLVSVQASKISTMLHQSSILGIIPPFTKILESPFRALVKGTPYAKTSRILLCMTIPALIFIFSADLINSQKVTIEPVFTITYWLVTLLQVSMLLYVAHVIIHIMWKNKVDPDNSAIPYLTALGDLSGSCFLAGAFWFLTEIGYGYKGKAE